MLLLVGLAGAGAALVARHDLTTLSQGLAPAIQANDAALVAMLDAETGLRGFIIARDPAYLPPLQLESSNVRRSLDTIDRVLGAAGEPGPGPLLDAERVSARSWLAFAGALAAETPTRLSPALLLSSERRFQAFRVANAAVTDLLRGRRDAVATRSAKARTVQLSVIVVGVFSALVLGASFGLYTARSVSIPLEGLWAVVRRLQDGELGARADDRTGPAEVRAVSTAVNRLAEQAEYAVAERTAADVLRGRISVLTAALRVGRDPDAMVRSLLAGLGGSMALDAAWFGSFVDPRVPVIRRHWSRTGARSVALDDDLAQLHIVTERLWRSDLVLAVTDVGQWRAGPDLDDTLDRYARSLGSGAFAAAAVGDGASAIGLLWLSVEQPRTWTEGELNAVQRLSIELAQSLTNVHLLAQQREAVRRLREADEAKSALVSTVSHELRTPLTSIVGYLDLLLDPESAQGMPEPAQHQLRIIERNAHRLQALIEDLLTQSQIEAGRLHAVIARTDLAEVLVEIQETMRPLADNAGMTLVIAVRQGLLAVDGDRLQLLQAFTNLVANAIKFGRPGGRVEVSATTRTDTNAARGVVAVTISDDGIGIPAAEVDRLFERFFRATNARSRVIGGTGLGLAIVHEIVTRHGGTVAVQSTLGTGTTMTVRLPLAG